MKSVFVMGVSGCLFNTLAFQMKLKFAQHQKHTHDGYKVKHLKWTLTLLNSVGAERPAVSITLDTILIYLITHVPTHYRIQERQQGN